MALPNSAYLIAPCNDLAHLITRLKENLPCRWTQHQQSPLIIYKIRCELPLSHPKMFYSLRVNDELTWTLSVCGNPLKVTGTPMLATEPK